MRILLGVVSGIGRYSDQYHSHGRYVGPPASALVRAVTAWRLTAATVAARLGRRAGRARPARGGLAVLLDAVPGGPDPAHRPLPGQPRDQRGRGGAGRRARAGGLARAGARAALLPRAGPAVGTERAARPD